MSGKGGWGGAWRGRAWQAGPVKRPGMAGGLGMAGPVQDSTPPACGAGEVRSTENMSNRAKDLQGGVWTWKQKRRSLGEIRQILHDRPQDLFDGDPMCGGALPMGLAKLI